MGVLENALCTVRYVIRSSAVMIAAQMRLESNHNNEHSSACGMQYANVSLTSICFAPFVTQLRTFSGV